MRFRDRSDAGRRLAAALGAYAGQRPVVLALPRGGVIVAAEVAAALSAAIDVVLVRKIGAPQQPELAMGAVVDGERPITVRNDDVIGMTGATETEFREIRDREITEIGRRRERYLGSRPHADVTGRTVILVDDGIATGATVRAALQATRRRRPRKLVLAVPVAPPDVLDGLRGEADDIVCLEALEGSAVAMTYDDFAEVSDAAVIEILARFPDAGAGPHS
ncbi:MAG: phosphoribosyltransferase [Alphaproteobacteria bacterium]|nr:phosphoribosyltransferase [Alphaproteobacteria bacterium]